MKKLSKIIIKSLLKPRISETHKGNFGHAMLIAGSKSKMGAAVIASKACLRAGTGLLTVSIPKKERIILQTTIPEAMLLFREDSETNWNYFSSIGIGPGIGLTENSIRLLEEILIDFKNPLLLDADALNAIAKKNEFMATLPENTILTPHPKEFDRLFGVHHTHEQRIATATKVAHDLHVIIVLKSHKTIITNGLETFINTTGNAGLAKAGSGDALTGIITSFLSQGYDPFSASKIGVFLHGLAADFALKNQSLESLLITDVVASLGKAFQFIHK